MAEYIVREDALSLVRPDYPTDVEAAVTIATAKKLVRKVLREAPAADVIPRPRWTPADEELPPEGVDVLCWYEYFRYGSYNRMYQTVGLGYQFGGDWNREVAQGRLAKVLAWMPLPEPLEMDGGADNG